jgi:hypothetical protein
MPVMRRPSTEKNEAPASIFLFENENRDRFFVDSSTGRLLLCFNMTLIELSSDLLIMSNKSCISDGLSVDFSEFAFSAAEFVTTVGSPTKSEMAAVVKPSIQNVSLLTSGRHFPGRGGRVRHVGT